MPGFFGKIPTHGDFVTRELSRGFIDVWDQWLQAGIAESKTKLGDRWLDVYLTSPIWRFGLVPGICGAGAWAGILMPSVDRVGRYFPLTIATALPANVNPTQLPGAAAWFEAMEAVALRTLDDDRFDANELQAAIASVGDLPAAAGRAAEPAATLGQAWSMVLVGRQSDAVAAALAHELVSRQAPRYSLWWTAGSEDGAGAAVAVAELPEPQCFVDLLHGARDPGVAAAAPEPQVAAGGSGP